MSEIYKNVEDYRRGLETGVMRSATPNVVRQLIGFLDDIRNDVKGLHQRKCQNCRAIHWHADHVTPYVYCPECGCQDTRMLAMCDEQRKRS